MEKKSVEIYEASSVHSDRESIVDLMAERPEQGSNFLAYANVVCVVAGNPRHHYTHTFRASNIQPFF